MASLCSSRSWLLAWSRLAGAHCSAARLTSKNSCSGFARCCPLVNCSRPRHRAGHHAARGGGKSRPRELQLAESGGAGRTTATEAAGRPTVRCRHFPEVEDLCFFYLTPKPINLAMSRLKRALTGLGGPNPRMCQNTG